MYIHTERTHLLVVPFTVPRAAKHSLWSCPAERKGGVRSERRGEGGVRERQREREREGGREGGREREREGGRE
jgi:hypothetical protein